MKNCILLFFLCLELCFSKSSASDQLNETILAEYLKLQKEFSVELCGMGTEQAFLSLDKSYRGDGNFIPITLDDKIDLKTIKSHLPLMKEKEMWLQAQIDFLRKLQNTKDLRLEIKLLNNNVSLLQEAKREYYFAQKSKRENIEKRAAKQFEQFLKELSYFKNKIPFLLGFKFPIDHLALRSEYETYKNQSNKEARARANSVYFYRKVIEDGSYDDELTRNDSVIRSAFNTLYLSLTKNDGRSFLTDNERVDFYFVFNQFDKLLSQRPEALILRFQEWKNRNARAMQFYQDLIEGKKIKFSENSQIQDVTSVLESKARSLYTLKEFVLTREARAYEFWSQRSELLQSLYVLETILYGEVGRIDGQDALERRDVAQVVINRSEDNNYNFLSEKDSIVRFLSPKMKTQENKWLNVLFKEGEFSFTYFYIPGNFHIYCPDMSKVGQFLRKENIRIALDLLNRPRKDFPALRYFSRMSMFGRIEMDSLWSDFKALPEVPGKLARHPKKLYDLFKKDRYKFLYNFTNLELKKDFIVVEMNGRIYVVDSKNPKLIYNYRNPHQFRYFSR